MCITIVHSSIVLGTCTIGQNSWNFLEIECYYLWPTYPKILSDYLPMLLQTIIKLIPPVVLEILCKWESGTDMQTDIWSDIKTTQKHNASGTTFVRWRYKNNILHNKSGSFYSQHLSDLFRSWLLVHTETIVCDPYLPFRIHRDSQLTVKKCIMKVKVCLI